MSTERILVQDTIASTFCELLKEKARVYDAGLPVTRVGPNASSKNVVAAGRMGAQFLIGGPGLMRNHLAHQHLCTPSIAMPKRSPWPMEPNTVSTLRYIPRTWRGELRWPGRSRPDRCISTVRRIMTRVRFSVEYLLHRGCLNQPC